MRFTADDLRNQRFKTKFQGLDKEDVLTYLELVADDFESFQKEAEKFKAQLKKKDKTIKKYKDREKEMKVLFEALYKEKSFLLDKLSNNPNKKESVKKGEQILRKALNRAKEIKEITEKGVRGIQKEILLLENHKKNLITTIKSKA
ncbi:MAG: DivIVA domain-containing protein [Nitrospinota bacterium]|nr:DivIVA domain-containing protein [Nitrospinota bacterium]